LSNILTTKQGTGNREKGREGKRREQNRAEEGRDQVIGE
jgi:hypothetical protein